VDGGGAGGIGRGEDVARVEVVVDAHQGLFAAQLTGE